MFQLNLKDNIKLVYILKNKIPFEIFTPAKIVKSLLTVAIATIKAYCDKYTYNLINHTKQDKFFLFYFKVKIYSRVHISSDTAFLNILKKPSIVQEYMLPHMNLLGFLHTEK